VIDTSVLVAGLVTEHEFHAIARRAIRDATVMSGVVLAETCAQLRRTVRLSASAASVAIRRWAATPGRIAVSSPEGYVRLFDSAAELGLGGNVHDAVIACTAAERGQPLVTLDRRQHAVATALGVPGSCLLPGRPRASDDVRDHQVSGARGGTGRGTRRIRGPRSAHPSRGPAAPSGACAPEGSWTHAVGVPTVG